METLHFLKFELVAGVNLFKDVLLGVELRFKQRMSLPLALYFRLKVDVHERIG